MSRSPPVLDAVLAPASTIVCLGKSKPGSRPMVGLVDFSASAPTDEEEFSGPAVFSKSMRNLSDIVDRKLAFYDPTVRGKGGK